MKTEESQRQKKIGSVLQRDLVDILQIGPIWAYFAERITLFMLRVH